MSAGVVVLGLGNAYRRDDGVGVAAAAAFERLALPGVEVRAAISDPMDLIEAWSGRDLAVVIDAVVTTPAVPGRVHRRAPADLDTGDGLSSHGPDVARAHALGRVLGRVPGALVVFTVEVADVGHGTGLSPRVAAAVPDVVGRVVDEVSRPTANRSRRPASR
ncbi:hydrogenase maturation protease [Mycobacterium sp. HUMS_1102779]|uniref:hydrogenase maturation protease n=1 Tax=Mycobacterium sp. HUMS_1102779 TaxID=3383487 RepID=UPI00389B0BE5